MPGYITAAVEGIIDEAVAAKLISHVGGKIGPVYGKQGKPYLRQQLSRYNNAARHAPWFMLIDLDLDADCAPPICRAWLGNPNLLACFRVAVRETEAWLLADPQSLAQFLSVSSARIPAQPESLNDPKMEMVNLARNSRRKAIREDMVPRVGSGRSVGPAYSSRVIEYIVKSWRPDVAATHADSLARTIRALRRLVESHP